MVSKHTAEQAFVAAQVEHEQLLVSFLERVPERCGKILFVAEEDVDLADKLAIRLRRRRRTTP